MSWGERWIESAIYTWPNLLYACVLSLASSILNAVVHMHFPGSNFELEVWFCEVPICHKVICVSEDQRRRGSDSHNLLFVLRNQDSRDLTSAETGSIVCTSRWRLGNERREYEIPIG